MSPEHWHNVKNILENALEIAPELRHDYLNRVCGTDEDLRREVEVLLNFDSTKSDFLEQNAFAAVMPPENGANLIGRQIGNYKIVSELGAGGMGAVYLAERADGEFVQKAALKLIKRGMDSDAVLRRFINERQILASLEHPNIARLIDGGTTSDGAPFFVMEYVSGKIIFDFAAEENLSLAERLDLFLEVCRAVSFAHQNLVIHRDLKPSNILITKDSKVKLLDFGIAKLLKSDDEAQTATQMHVFTPEYASPEQVKGEKLTTATDVYSLGVILYELLTGNRPYQTASKNISDIIKAVCETEPIRPSSVVVRQSSVVSRPLTDDTNATDENREQKTNNDKQNTSPKSRIQNTKSLKGDLDNIILKALRKEPERRYSSVEQFAEDIRRHQNGLPVMASKDTWNYRAAKFIRRNRLAATAATLILITLIGGLGATLYQRNKAQRRFNDVRQLANSFLFEFHDAIENLPGATPARELVVKRAVEYLDKLAAETGDANNAGLQRELATAYERVGKIQGNPYSSNLGDTTGATASYQKSLEIRRRLNQTDPTNREIQHELAAAYEGLGDMQRTTNDLPNGWQNYKEALKIRLPLVEAEPQNLNYLAALSELYMRRGDIKGNQSFANFGDTNGALEEYTRAVAAAEKYAAADTSDDSQALLAIRLESLATLQNDMGNSAEALVNARRAAAIFEPLAARNPNNARLKTHWITALTVVSYALIDQDQLAEAEKTARFAVAESEKAVAADPRNVDARFNLSTGYNNLASILRQDERSGEAIAAYQRGLEVNEKLYADAPSADTKSELMTTLSVLAESQIDVGDYAAALANLERCAAGYEKDLAESPENARAKDDLAETYTFMGKTLAELNQTVRAGEIFDRAVLLSEQVARESPDNAKVQTRLARTYFVSGKHWKTYARAFKDEKAQVKACDLIRKSLDLMNEMRQKGTLGDVNAGRIEQIAKELNDCRKV